MEIVGFIIGVIKFVKSFMICVNCFNYIRISCYLGCNYESLMIKLDFIQFRFIHWNQIVGFNKINEIITFSQIKQHLAIHDKNIETICQTFRQISNFFEKFVE